MMFKLCNKLLRDPNLLVEKQCHNFFFKLLNNINCLLYQWATDSSVAVNSRVVVAVVGLMVLVVVLVGVIVVMDSESASVWYVYGIGDFFLYIQIRYRFNWIQCIRIYILGLEVDHDPMPYISISEAFPWYSAASDMIFSMSFPMIFRCLLHGISHNYNNYNNSNNNKTSFPSSLSSYCPQNYISGPRIFQNVVSVDSRLLYGDSERLYFLR